jgi:hypothetical protein
VRRTQVETELKNKEERHHQRLEEMHREKSEEDFMRKSLSNIR